MYFFNIQRQPQDMAPNYQQQKTPQHVYKTKNTQKVTHINEKVWDSMDIIFISRLKCVTY